MKISPFFTLLLLFVLSSTGCEKQDLGVGDFGATSNFINFFFPNVINITVEENNIFYPKVFSDNPDVEFIVELMEIFDRNGNPIYQAEQFPTNDLTYGWDGTFEGNLVESSSYSYSTRISDGIGTRLFVGDFVVLR